MMLINKIKLSILEKCLITLCILLLVALGVLFVTWLQDGIRVSIVAGKVSILLDLEEISKKSHVPKEIAVSAQKAAEFGRVYRGKSEDIILSLVASNVVRNMCAVLRKQTGLDIGDDPNEWIRCLKTNEIIFSPTNSHRIKN